MQFAILGPLEVRRDGRVVALGGAKPRALLAVLLLHANEPVSADRLAGALWGDEAPAGAVRTVQVHVSRLRRALGEDGDGLLSTTAAGYVLRVRPGELDADRFERLVGDARAALADGRPGDAGGLLREALALWRGPPLADLAFEPFAQSEIQRLEEQRLEALEARLEADLAAGRHAELVGELQWLVGEHPLRERFSGQLMLALYRAGRQADALQAYRSAREALVEQLGVEPSEALRQLEQAILTHSAELASPPPAARPRDRISAPPNRTIGRTHELDAIGARLCDRFVRLLTLTGPGGVGKTRLALEAARQVEQDFADGACFVLLAALQRPDDVPAAIVTALGGIVLSGESPVQALERFLAVKQLLLVVDNFEHVLAAAPVLGGLLDVCPALTVLATSREPLSLHAEERYPVTPLALPEQAMLDDPVTLAGVGAVALFCERARARDPHFDLADADLAVVADICLRLDGLPLAIELAAARCGVLSAGEIAERLEATLGALGAGPRDAPARQQTLRATIDWSYNLLSDREKQCFARFAVFTGGATVDAAETITGAGLDTLDRLVAKGLLVRRQQPHMPTRLLMLETVRTYATERLGTARNRQSVRERHYGYFLALVRHHGSARALWGTSRKDHLAQLDAEIDNLHADLGWAAGQASAGPALELCAELGWYWLMRDRYADAVDWIEQALRKPGVDLYPALRFRLLCFKAWALWPLGRRAEQAAVMAEAEAIARTLADPLILSQALQMRAMHEGASNRLDVAATLADEALHWANAATDEWAIAMAAFARAMAARSTAELRERVDRAASLLANVGNVYHLAHLLAAAIFSALCNGSDRDANEGAVPGSG
jgi:predicted ATPase